MKSDGGREKGQIWNERKTNEKKAIKDTLDQNVYSLNIMLL